MLKKFQTQEGDITIEITEKGKAIYSVGKKKTTFDLSVITKTKCPKLDAVKCP